MTSALRNFLIATSALIPFGFAYANPQDGQVVGGAAAIQSQGATTTITQTTPSAIINWNTFNIGAGETTKFIQPDASSIALNRVTGGLGPSQIYGTISANGRVFLVNPDGILFGAGSRVDTAGFLATTNDIKNSDFMAGKYNFNIPGKPDASIVNLGAITAADTGIVALVAPGVRNAGVITANLGTVALSSGNAFTLDFYGDKLITLQVGDAIAGQVKDVATGQPLNALVKNEGTLRANGGKVALTAVAARQIVDSVVNNTGVIEANSVGFKNGEIILGAATAATKAAGAPKQTVKVSGTISASGKNPGEKGGKVQITGEDIKLVSASIDTSGAAGGGKALIGGDVGGGGVNPLAAGKVALESAPIATASWVTVDAASSINASATQAGDGGKVVVWSDQVTSFAGLINASGGATSGNGGFVETSGRSQLNFTGLVDTRAPNGLAGLLLLDPADYYVDIPGGPTRPPGASVITDVTLQNQLANGNVLIATDNVSNPGGQNGDIFVTSQVTWSANTTLTLSAFRNIEIQAPSSSATIINTGGGSLILRADSTGTGVGTITLTYNAVSNRIDWSGSTGAVSFYYNPASYASPTNFTTGNGHVTTASASQFTAYMLVNSLANLQSVGTNLSQNFALGRNIDATGFTPFGIGTTYSGQFDGSGGLGANYTISNLTLNMTGSPVGLFGFIGSAGKVSNLNLANINVTAGSNLAFVGTLAGENDGTIANVHVLSGSVSGGTHTGIGAGGLVGQNRGTITNSSAAVNVSVGSAVSFSQMNMAGGLVGSNLGLIGNSSASGNVVIGSFANAGGLVGTNQNFDINNNPIAGAVIDGSFATGNVSSTGSNIFLGGLVGSNMPHSIISNSRATGNIISTGIAVAHDSGDCNLTNTCAPIIVGGLVGQNSGTITGTAATASLLANCVAGATCASGHVSVGSRGTAGGLVGSNDGIITYAFATGLVDGAAGTAPANANKVFDDATQMGGFVGGNHGQIFYSWASGNVGGSQNYLSAGGFAGDNSGTIAGSYAFGNVTAGASSTVGGFTPGNGPDNSFSCGNCYTGDGSNNDGLIVGAGASGNVTAGSASLAGGFAAGNSGGLLGVVALGDVSVGGNSIAGGLVGVQDSGGSIFGGAYGSVTGTGANSVLGGLVGANAGLISSSVAFGNVFGGSDSYIGGLVGINVGTVVNSFVDPVVSGSGANNAVGGFAGYNGGIIDQSGAIADVSSGGNSFVNGPVGINNGSATNSTFTGAVTPSFGTSLPGLPSWLAGCGDSLCSLISGLTLPVGSLSDGNSGTVVPPITQIALVPPIDPNANPTPINLTPPVTNSTSGSSTGSTGSTGGPGDAGRPPVNPGPPQTSGPPPGAGIGRSLSEQQFSGAPPLGETRFQPSEVVVQISNTIPLDRIQEVARQLGITLASQQSFDAAGRIIYRFRTGDGRDVRDIIKALEKNQVVASAQPNYVFSLQQAATPPAAATPSSAEQAPADLAQSDVASRTTTLPTGDSAQYVIDMLKLTSLHQRVRGRGVVIAVVDSEIDSQHPDLRGSILEQFNATQTPSNPHTHGTGMAGAIVAKARLLGIAPESRILAIKAFDENAASAEATSYQILAGLDHAIAKGAKIINMSFAGPRDLMMERTLKAAYDKGIVLVAAAGNAGPKSPPLFPAADPNVIAVSAVDYADKPFAMANRGKYISVVAPGVDVLVPAPKAGYQLTTGTSVAAAHVSGVVALLLEARPNLTPRDIRAILTRTAKPVMPRDKDNQTGAGLVDPIQALQSIVTPHTAENSSHPAATAVH